MNLGIISLLIIIFKFFIGFYLKTINKIYLLQKMLQKTKKANAMRVTKDFNLMTFEVHI